jgi:hypothetical protein
MAEFVELSGHVAGDEFSRLLSLSASVSSYSALAMIVSKRWALPGESSDPLVNPNIVAKATLGAGITQTDDAQVRVTIPSATLEIDPRTYVYTVTGTTLAGARVTLVRGLLVLDPRG